LAPRKGRRGSSEARGGKDSAGGFAPGPATHRAGYVEGIAARRDSSPDGSSNLCGHRRRKSPCPYPGVGAAISSKPHNPEPTATAADSGPATTDSPTTNPPAAA